MQVETSLAALRAELSRDDRDLRVYTDHEDRLIGWLSARMVADEAELMEMVIAPEYRRRGLGGQMLDGLIQRIGHGKGIVIHLEVRVTNVAAIALYESRSFERVGMRRSYYADGEDALVYSLGLTSLG